MPSITQETPTFESFYTCYLPLVRHVLGSLGGYARQHSDDLVQETFVRAWKGYAGLDRSQNVAGWITRIAQRVLCDYMRHRYAHQGLDRRCMSSLDDEHAPDLPDLHTDAQLTWVEESSAIARAYHHLRPEDQHVLTMLAQEYTHAEIAAVLHLDREACRVRVDRARRRFRRYYAQA